VQWSKQRILYVAPGTGGSKRLFCVGSWRGPDGKHAASRILPQANCGGGAWAHDLTFDPDAKSLQTSAAFTLCVGRLSSGAARVSARSLACSGGSSTELGRFPVWAAPTSKGDQTYGLCTRALHKEEEGMFCKNDRGTDCCPLAWKLELQFSVPTSAQKITHGAPRKTLQRIVCVGRRGASYIVRFNATCDHEGAHHEFSFFTPSLEDIVRGSLGETSHGLITLIKEDTLCPTFICPDTLASL